MLETWSGGGGNGWWKNDALGWSLDCCWPALCEVGRDRQLRILRAHSSLRRPSPTQTNREGNKHGPGWADNLRSAYIVSLFGVEFHWEKFFGALDISSDSRTLRHGGASRPCLLTWWGATDYFWNFVGTILDLFGTLHRTILDLFGVVVDF